jgi:hypothetical protein
VSKAKPQQTLLPSFGGSFLEHHAGRVIADPEVAIVELVANCSDAGADRVDIQWPTVVGGALAVTDNGIGMTEAEFTARWRELSYDRRKERGTAVDFPKGVRKRPRVAYGRAGIGRHAMFCFASEYGVETCKDGLSSSWNVRRSAGALPFAIDPIGSGRTSKHGTTISCKAERVQMAPETVAELIGSRFVADPDFAITINGQPVELTDLDERCEQHKVDVEGLGPVQIRRYEGERPGRTSRQHGVAFWVKRRLCGIPSWEVYDRPLLDARRTNAKRFTYVVEADLLEGFVKDDWTGFHASAEVNLVRKTVSEFIVDDLRDVMSEVRRERKRAALQDNRHRLRDLPPLSQEVIATFAGQVQEKCPSLEPGDLGHVVEILANLERARSGYSLLETLSSLKPEEYDQLDAILESWTVSDIKKVLGELRYRLELIDRLELLVDKATTDELHDLQPVFERGLWMFGPEFESVSFVSNRSLATIVEQFFGSAVLTTPRKRPDFVVLPDSSIGVYACDNFDERHEVSGIAKVVIVELKRGGFELTNDEKDQALKYARQLRRSGKVGLSIPIVCHVLGSRVAPDANSPMAEGDTSVLPRSYAALLRGAHARTFNLLKSIRSVEKWRSPDEDLNAVLDDDAMPLFQDRLA